MDILAENRFTLSKQLFSEGLTCLSWDTYGKSAKKITLVLFAIWAVMSAVLMFIGGNLVHVLTYLAAIGAICLWINVLLPRKHIKKNWEALVNRCGDDLERSTRFFEDRLEIEAGDTLKIVPYCDIVTVKQTDKLYLLVCQNKVGVMVAKDGFVSGSAEEIMALIAAAQNEGA